jgi:hypothetical protein
MTMTGPIERAAYLASIGAEPAWMARSRDEAYRNGYRVVGEPGPLQQVAELWREPAYLTSEVLDVEASYRTQRLVRRTRTINTICRCGGEAYIPPVQPDGEYVCDLCARIEQGERAEYLADANLAARSFDSDIAELLGAYDRPGGLRNMVAYR